MDDEVAHGPRLVRRSTGTGTPQVSQPPLVPSLQRCFRRECAEVQHAMEGFGRALEFRVGGLATLVDAEDISWDDIEDQETSLADTAVGIPLDLVRRLVLPPDSPVSPDDFSRRCGGSGPYFGIRQRGDGYCVYIYDEAIEGRFAEWDDGAFFDVRRWQRAFDAWREHWSRNLGGHFAATHAELLELRGSLPDDDRTLRLPPELLRRIFAQPENVCPDCLSTPPATVEVEVEPDGSVVSWASCASCSRQRPGAVRITGSGPFPDHFKPTHRHAVSGWRSWAEFVSPERWESAYACWLAGE